MAYERLVQAVYQAILNAEGLTNVKVLHNTELQGLTSRHQIDVYWEYRFGGELHRVAIECKCYAEPVSLEKVRNLKGVLDDVPGVRGVLVSTSGFQSGVLDYARGHGIGLKTIRAPVESDYAGRLRGMRLNLSLLSIYTHRAIVSLDRPWIQANLTPEVGASLNGPLEMNTGMVIEDRGAGTRMTIQDLERTLPNNARKPALALEHEFTWDDAFIHLEAGPIKIRSLRLTYEVGIYDSSSEVRWPDAAAIVRDALNGALLFVDAEGSVTGDTETLLGSASKSA